MKKIIVIALLLPIFNFAQDFPQFTDEVAVKLSEKPLHCISQEFPNKTGHTLNNETEVALSPKDLHAAFYGCYDWHSCVHGHWMLVRILKTKPHLSNAAEIEQVLDNTFQKENMIQEAAYFSKFKQSATFERTYGWAWLLKLDEELATWDDPRAKKWHENLKPLAEVILKKWKDYLPKQTYPNRTGVHPNTAFAMGFALDWARATNDKIFEKQLIDKSKYFFANDKKIPAHLEPDGSDFFSPSLETADLMRRVLPSKDFVKWLKKYYTKDGLNNIEQIPIVSDINDFQTVHLVGLSFSKAWCMKGIAKALPENNAIKKTFEATSNQFLENALPLIFQGNYGGDHWLASFAVLALE